MKLLNEKTKRLTSKIGVWGLALILMTLVAIPATAFAAVDKHAVAQEQKSDDENEKVDAAQAATAKITKKQAADIAIAANKGATMVGVELENDHGMLVYAVDLKTADGNVMEAKVDAMSGVILATETNTEDDNEKNDRKGNDAEEVGDSAKEAEDDAALAGKAALTVEQANETALTANPGATVIKTGLGDENSTVIYEVKITTADGKKAEVKVDANTGKILPEDNDNETND